MSKSCGITNIVNKLFFACSSTRRPDPFPITHTMNSFEGKATPNNVSYRDGRSVSPQQYHFQRLTRIIQSVQIGMFMMDHTSFCTAQKCCLHRLRIKHPQLPHMSEVRTLISHLELVKRSAVRTGSENQPCGPQGVRAGGGHLQSAGWGGQ